MLFGTTSIRGAFFPQPKIQTIGLGNYLRPDPDTPGKQLPGKLLNHLERHCEAWDEPGVDPLDVLTLLAYTSPHGNPTNFTSAGTAYSPAYTGFMAIGGSTGFQENPDLVVAWIRNFGLPIYPSVKTPLCNRSPLYKPAKLFVAVENVINAAYPEEPVMFLHHVEILAQDFFLLNTLCRHWRNGSLDTDEAKAAWKAFYGSYPASPINRLQEELWKRLSFHLQRTSFSPQLPSPRDSLWSMKPVIVARDPMAFIYTELLADLSQDSMSKLCPICKQFFVASRKNVTCCSSKCSNTYRQRTYTKNKREALLDQN